MFLSLATEDTEDIEQEITVLFSVGSVVSVISPKNPRSGDGAFEEDRLGSARDYTGHPKGGQRRLNRASSRKDTIRVNQVNAAKEGEQPCFSPADRAIISSYIKLRVKEESGDRSQESNNLNSLF
jgi:hypothetical protein